MEAKGLSWPAWRASRPDNAARIRAFVEDAAGRLPARSTRVALAGHSGGGSFLFGYINSAEAIPDSDAAALWATAPSAIWHIWS